MKITVREFEEKVLALEEVVITIRASSHENVDDYDFERKASGSMSVTEWVEGRIKQRIGDMEFVILNGGYTNPHGRTKMSTLRESYEK